MKDSKSPTKCFKRGQYGARAYDALSNLPHEIQEGDERRITVLFLKAHGNLQGLTRVTTGSDAAAAQKLLGRLDRLAGVIDDRSVSKRSKLALVASVAIDVSKLHRSVSRSCSSRV